MPIDELKKIPIDELLGSPAGEWIGRAMDIISSVQKNLFAISEREDGNQLTLMKIGTVFQIFLIDKLASGKKPSELTEEDWNAFFDCLRGGTVAARSDDAAAVTGVLPSLMYERRQRRFLFGRVLQGGRYAIVFTPFTALRSGSQRFAVFPCGSDGSQSVILSRFSPLFLAVQMGRILLPFPCFAAVQNDSILRPFPMFHRCSRPFHAFR